MNKQSGEHNKNYIKPGRGEEGRDRDRERERGREKKPLKNGSKIISMSFG